MDDKVELSLIKAQWRSQQGHIVFLKDGSQYLRIRWATAGSRPKLFVKLVSSARRVDDDDLARLISKVQESVRDFRRHIGKAAFGQVEDLVANADFELALQNEDRLLLHMVNMQWGASVRRDSDHKIIEGPTRIFARHLEGKVPSRTGLKGQTFVFSQDNVTTGYHMFPPLAAGTIF